MSETFMTSGGPPKIQQIQGEIEVAPAVGGATEAKQDTIISHIDTLETLLTDIEANQLPDSHNVTIDNASLPVTNAGTFPVQVDSNALVATAVDASSSGDNTVVSITGVPRLFYISLSANGANSADVTATVKIGSSTKYKVSLKAGAIWARNVGAGRGYITGVSGDDIVVNLSVAQTVHVSIEYADV